MKEMLSRGVFGNTMRCWETLDGLMSSGYRGNVYVRTNTKMDKPYFEIPIADVPNLDVDHECCHYYESPPNDSRVIQGEFYHGVNGFYLQCSFEKTPLREALNSSPRHLFGSVAIRTLKHFVDEYDKLLDLVDEYDAIVEFSQFSNRIGELNKRLIIWEVRSY